MVTHRKIYLVVGGIYREKANQEAQGCHVVVEPRLTKHIEALKRLLEPHKRVCFETDLSYSEYQLFRGSRSESEFYHVPSTTTELMLRVGLIDKLAAVKDKGEINKIQKAVKLTEDIFEHHIAPQVKPGITEKDLASEITKWGAKYGAEKDAFDIIVASGPRSSLPHGWASLKKIEAGDIVQFDFGYVVDGYPSDFSRVVFTEEPTTEQKRIYDIVLTAQSMAIKAASPGMRCDDLDKIARDYIKSHGYDIPHALGHGLGILIHTAPRIGQEEQEELKPGHVITIEPGIYIPGWGGIRLEDVIVITETGCRNLTTYPK